MFQRREKAGYKWQNASIASIYRIRARNNSCANPSHRGRKFLPLRALSSAPILGFCVMGFRPASERLASAPASHRDRVFGLSGFFLVVAILLSPLIPGDASARAASDHGLQTPSVLALDMFDAGKIDALDASEPVSTDVWSKIEAIRRMGGRSLWRPSQRHDLTIVPVVWKPAESTENPVRNVTKCGACQALVNEGLGRAPPRFDL